MNIDLQQFETCSLTNDNLKKQFKQFTYFPDIVEWLSSTNGKQTILARLIANTEASIQKREMGWQDQLCRAGGEEGIEPEARWERTIWRKFRPDPRSQPVSEFHPLSPKVLSYQVPLYGKQDSAGWGKIDLLGISPEGFPVVVEVKAENSKESPLAALMEAVRYAVALRVFWRHGFREQWCEELEKKGVTKPDLMEDLSRCQIIIAAPSEYWGERGPETKSGERYREAWVPFMRLCTILDSHHRLSAELVQLEFSARSLRVPK